ncbi:hypothetical protein LCGC14_2567330 [marine sediment metagenome]|uniref:Uncharacterized protein n=1 Tax=marine sediment metagenome TaxID=412755 RepID=A0A0F9B690_9ZZZZ
MNKKILVLVFVGLFLISFASAEQQSLGIFKLGECIPLSQTCGNCTYNNVTNVLKTGENSIAYNINSEMSQNEIYYNHTFCGNITENGIYNVHGFGDPDGEKTSWVYKFQVTPNGTISSTGSSLLYALFIIILSVVLLVLTYFIIAIPSENLKDERGVVIGIIKLKYIRILLIGILYPLTIVLLNLMNSLAVNVATLSTFSGTIGFLFQVMLRAAWPFTIILIVWVFYLLVKDTNIKRGINKLEAFMNE